MFLAVFLCFINIDKTYLLIQDTARDSVRMIEIWQSREVTLIGPPASSGQRTEREFYFGSLSYYLGIFGLVITGFEAWGAVIGQVLIFVFSIPFAYLLFKDKIKLKYPIVGVILYTLSPLALIHMRFYWNPNVIIGLSTIFWYLVLNERKKSFNLTFSGIITGLVFNFHYVASFPLFFWFFYLLLQRKFKDLLLLFLGFVLGSSPIWIFELRNNFFLSKTFWFNLKNAGNSDMGVNLSGIFESLWRFQMAVIGIKPLEIEYEVFFNQPWQEILGVGFLLLMVLLWRNLKRKERVFFVLTVLASILAGVFSGDEFYGRYLFGIYTIFVWVVVKTLEKITWVWPGIFLLIILTNLKIISFRPDPNKNYIGLKLLEDASLLIKEDLDSEKYNLSENIYGDAQARGLRFFVLKNIDKKPENDVSYRNLDVLYVLTPSLEKTMSENRYEYYAPRLTKAAWEQDLGKVKLIKFNRE